MLDGLQEDCVFYSIITMIQNIYAHIIHTSINNILYGKNCQTDNVTPFCSWSQFKVDMVLIRPENL